MAKGTQYCRCARSQSEFFVINDLLLVECPKRALRHEHVDKPGYSYRDIDGPRHVATWIADLGICVDCQLKAFKCDEGEGCDDEDKVARQLCEAATEEEDPFLRAALWDEYNEYKNIILRQ